MLIIQKRIEKVNRPAIEEKLQSLIQEEGKITLDEAVMKLIPLKDTLDLETLFIVVYCIVSDFVNLIGGQKNLRTSNNNDPLFTDAEVITIALVGELAGNNSQNAWYRYLRKNYHSLFPDLCSRSRFSRRISRLNRVISFFQQHLSALLSASYSQQLLIDTFPIEVCNYNRAKSSSRPLEYHGADFGYCSSKKLNYYGFKGHLVTDLRGIPVYLMLTSARPHDLHPFEAVICDMLSNNILRGKTLFVGDKGYVGQEFQQYILQTYGVQLISLQKQYKKQQQQTALNCLLNKSRKIIETSINLLACELNACHTRRRSIKGLINSLLAKITAFNLGNFINLLLKQPLLHIKSFVF